MKTDICRPTLDRFRMIAAFLIVAIHTSPLSSLDPTADFLLTRVIARIAVPFFLMTTGYFVCTGSAAAQKKFFGKTGLLYLISIVLYLPLNLYNHYFSSPQLTWKIVKDLIFDGTFYHLWYLPAAIVGAAIAIFLLRRCGLRGALILSSLLYLIGLFGDSYYGLSSQISFLTSFYHTLFSLFDYTRNGLLFAPLFLVLGAALRLKKPSFHKKHAVFGLVLSSSFLIAEALILRTAQLQRHDSMYLFLIPAMYFLFFLLLSVNRGEAKTLRSLSLLIYLLHPWCIVLVRGGAKLLRLTSLVVENSVVFYLSVSILTLCISLVLQYLWRHLRPTTPSETGRAYVEVDLSALRHNAQELRRILPSQCALMAVVKANAYHHGDIEVCHTLSKSGVHTFAVATLAEGIHLRRAGIRGDILILGYTDPKDSACLSRYRLIQTVVDLPHAKALSQTGLSLRVHVKIDTGMHRLGEPFYELERLSEIYTLPHLHIEGTFTHLCVADSESSEDIAFTKLQIRRFYKTVSLLKEMGYHPGKLHIQSSYGILNYPNLECNYARPGIALYGVLSSRNHTRLTPLLRPVLSVRAHVASVKEIPTGDSIGYGRSFVASRPIRAAVLTIGYADGIPRSLSGAPGAYVLIHGQKAPIIGRICMDQMSVDVSDISDVAAGDFATLIGPDGANEIRCEDFAADCKTISNEILSRLSSRLPRLFKE